MPPCDDSHLFKPLPRPTGTCPYRLYIRQVLGEITWFLRQRMTFHMVGDTGCAQHSMFQSVVASAMAEQTKSEAASDAKPAFLFHLGDIVYNYGETNGYPKQFFGPYEEYLAPIVAIAGRESRWRYDPRVEEINEAVHRIRLESFCDDRFGFLKITMERTGSRLLLIGEYYTVVPNAIGNGGVNATLFERFVVPINQQSYSLY